MTAYYNEIDPYAAQWLRNLIQAGHIAPGHVDERSIEDVRPADLAGFVQCHFFAGVGVWSLALRRAGWADDRPVWTGSCPCQPFSAAGAGAGFSDERHLWPAFFHLIEQCRPAIVAGEQVASKDAEPWIDLVQADVEALDYAFGAVPFPSAGVGAPHIRDRLYWVADAHGSAGGKGRAHVRGRADGGHAQSRAGLGCSGMPDGLDHTNHTGLAGHRRGEAEIGWGEHGVRPAIGPTGAPGGPGRLAYANGRNPGAEREQRSGEQRQQPQDGSALCGLAHADGSIAQQSTRQGSRPREAQGGRAFGEPERCGALSGAPSAGPTNGLWRDADWLLCRDGKWRPVEPGTLPLAHGAASRVGRLRAYGNAINAEAARVFIESVMT